MTGPLLYLLVALADPPAAMADPPAQADDAPTRDVYEVHLAVDVPVTVVAGSAGLVRILFGDQLARKSCPCDPGGINALDRGTVGNHSAAAGVAANVTVYGLMAALPVVDLLDVGFGRTWGDDLMIYAETLAIDTALQNATNLTVAARGPPPPPRQHALS